MATPSIQALAIKAQAIVANPNLSAKSKSAQLDAIEEQILDAKHLEAQRRQAINTYGTMSGAGSSKAFNLGAPSLAFTDADVKELQTAALAGQVHRKAAVESSEAAGIQTQYVASAFPFLRDRVRIADYIPSSMTQDPTVTYFRATTAAANAAAVAEGANKPESTPLWETVTATARKIAHYARVNDEVLADADGFRQVLGQEMLAGLIDEENDQLLTGNGIAPNLLGLLNATGVQTQALGTDTRLDALAKAITLLRTGSSFTEPDLIVLNPADWQDVVLSKDADSNYLVGDATTAGPSRIWGVPVVVTNRITAGTALVANMKEAARLYWRQPPTVEVAPASGAEFIANQTLIRAESRVALAIVRPSALVTVTGI